MTDKSDTKQVRRYNLENTVCQGETWREMRRDDDYGEWVKADDYSALVAENEGLKRMLKNYGRHGGKCHSWLLNGKCTCGLEADPVTGRAALTTKAST